MTLLAMAIPAAADDAPPTVVEALRSRVLAQAAVQPGMHVAEIGIGHGWFVFRAAEAAGPDGVVYGTDIDAEAIAAIKPQLANLDPKAARVDLRLCRDERDTAVDDLPDGTLDLVLMVDSLCFDGRLPRQTNIDYLTRFQRILKPGGRLVHHMDCHCDVSVDALVEQFTAAGFSPGLEAIEAPTDPNGPCQTEVQRRRDALIAVFHKPAAK